MSSIAVPHQGAFLSEMGHGTSTQVLAPVNVSDPERMREIAMMVSNLVAAKPKKEPAASSTREEATRSARKTRATLALRYELMRSRLEHLDGYNPLATIRNRECSNFKAPQCIWEVTNDENIHDISYIRLSRAAGVCTEQSSPRGCKSSTTKHGQHHSQHLISRLQEKHTECPPQITVSSADTETDEVLLQSTDSEGQQPLQDLDRLAPLYSDNNLLECTQRELSYIVLVLNSALRQQTRTAKCSDGQVRCQDYKNALQRSTEEHLELLAARDRTALDLQTAINTRIANHCEHLKLDADRTMAEINTNLNLKLRDSATMLTMLEGCPGSHCFLQMGYAALEVAVRLLLRSIWFCVSVGHILKRAIVAVAVIMRYYL